jgi:DNA-binding beta-propeller fold protein YncE
MRVYLLPLLLGLGCGAMDDADSVGDWSDASNGSVDAGGWTGCFSSNDCPTGWSCTEFGTCEAPSSGGPVVTPPPEVEREFSAPTSALRFVYVAMTDLGALAKIDGATLGVASLAVSDRPEIVAAVPGTDDAIVIDRSAATATIVRPTVDRDEKITLRTLPRLNVLSVAPSGRFAVAWFDLTRAVIDAGGLAGIGELGSFQDVSVIVLERGAERVVDLAVGFRPREVEFSEDGSHAFVITDDGVSVIDLAEAATGASSVAAAIPVLADPLVDLAVPEVDITADGRHAVVRITGVPGLRVVQLLGDGAGRAYDVPLPAEATDVDLAPDGARAYAVLRELSTLAVIDIPGDAQAPEGIDLVSIGTELVGSAVLDAAGRRALLFTNAADVERVTIVDLAAEGYPHIVRPLQKGIRTVAFSPDGEKALILHSRRPGNPAEATNVEDYVDRSHGYSLLDVSSGFAKLAVTPVDPGSFAFSPDSAAAYLALDGGDGDGALARLQIIDLDTFVVRDLRLGSPPEDVGVLPAAGVVYVNQRHPLGRVTFVDLATSASDTVTGFELNGHIVD